jgi:phenylpropionate dioxygenase-like ring-hydroxylating dioxygenase large terminal subunit
METEIPRDLINSQTQPQRLMPVFNNPSVVANGWYFVIASKDLKAGQIFSFKVGHQSLVVFRTKSGAAAVLDAYCPHMGTHFSKGKVVGENIQCFFHHWKFSAQGECVDVPAEPSFCKNVRANSFATQEFLGAIWVYPSAQADRPIVGWPELHGVDLEIKFGTAYTRQCHHHVTMINGIDPQHLKTVHNLKIDMKVQIDQATDQQIDITLTGDISDQTLLSRWTQKLMGRSYTYSMLYDHASVGFLTLVKDSYWFGGSQKMPSLYMLFAYVPNVGGGTKVQPIFVTRKRSGIIGKLTSWVMIFSTQMAFRALQGEDGEVYENMRFNPQKLLPMDLPVSQYIQYVNRLKPSKWSLVK